MPMPGCLVPSGKKDQVHTNPDPLRCHGLLFADDLVALASVPDELIGICVHVTAWCEENEMQVGIHKCGIMEFVGNDKDGFPMTAVFPEEALECDMLLCGQQVPLVETYTYLGIEITTTLSFDEIIAPRVESGRKTVMSLAPFLSCPIIPMSSRWIVVQMVVLPRLLYGAEIYGMCRDLTKATQNHFNFALRCVLGIPRWRHMSSLLLWKEMRMKPICAIAAGRRARAHNKCFQLRTWVNQLINRPLRIQKWTWVSGTKRWIGMQCKKHSHLPAEAWADWTSWEPQETKKRAEAAIVVREFGIRGKDGYRDRAEVRKHATREYELKHLVHARVPYDPALVTGMTWISRFRTTTVATAAQMFAWGKLEPCWTTRCPCCRGETTQEDAAHIFLECSRWHEHRQTYLSPIIRQIAELAPPVPFTRTDRLALLLGGTAQALSLPVWLPPRTDPYESDSESDDDSSSELSSSSDISSRSSDHSVVGGTRLGDIPVPEVGCLQVAAFLTPVMRLRQRHLGEHPHWPPPRSEEPPIRTPGQRPAG